jgi:preprotein translocase subunit SecB
MKGTQGLLDINEYCIRELTIKENPTYKPKKIHEGTAKISHDILRKSPDLDFMINMKVRIGTPTKMSETEPYYISITISGLFNFTEKTDESTIAKMIQLNGLSILYGITRGIVAQATSSYLHGQYVLPTINFVEMLKRQSAKRVPKKKRARQGK